MERFTHMYIYIRICVHTYTCVYLYIITYMCYTLYMLYFKYIFQKVDTFPQGLRLEGRLDGRGEHKAQLLHSTAVLSL